MAEHPNVALVRKGMEAFNSGDMAGIAEYIADDTVWSGAGLSDPIWR